MSTILFGKVGFTAFAEQLTFVSENVQMSHVLLPVLKQYKNIREFVNDLSRANLRSWRKAYPKANRFRYDKLPRTRELKSRRFILRNLIQNLSRLAYNIDYDCPALSALEKLIDNLIGYWIQTLEFQNNSDMFQLPETPLTTNNFKSFYGALVSLRFSAFAYCKHGLEELNFGGVRSFNYNNKQFYGIERVTGGIRASYLRSIKAPSKEKLSVATYCSKEFDDAKLHDVLLYALRFLNRVNIHITGRTSEVVEQLYNSLADDLLNNDYMWSNQI